MPHHWADAKPSRIVERAISTCKLLSTKNAPRDLGVGNRPDDEHNSLRFLADFWRHCGIIEREGSAFGLRPLVDTVVSLNCIVNADAKFQTKGCQHCV